MSNETVVLNPVQLNAELEKAIAAQLDPASIRAVILAEAEKQTGEAQVAAQAAVEKKAAEEKAAADALAAAPAPSFTRTELINGKEFNFEGTSELDLATQIANAYRVASAFTSREQVAVPAVDPAIAEAAAQKEIADKAAAQALLEVKFRNGDLSASDYIEQSGAVDDYLTRRGIPVESLKAVVEQKQTSQFEQSWAEATDAFKRGAGHDWPYGARNLKVIGLKIAELGLTDADDKVAALSQAYQAMKDEGLVFPLTPEEAAEMAREHPQVNAAARAAAQAEADAVVAARKAALTTTPGAVAAVSPAAVSRAASSGLFGLSSGAGATTETGKVATTVSVDPNASPAQIMDAWKKAQLAQGINPDDAFRSQFSNRRS